MSSPSEEIERLKIRTGEKMNGLLYTYKTHYKMAEFYEKASTFSNLVIAIGTGLLALSLIQEIITPNQVALIAIGISLISWITAVFKFGKKSQVHYNTADKYHSLFENYADFAKLTLPSNEISMGEKKEEFKTLSEQRESLNENSPRTTNLWYGRLSKQDVFSTMETDSDELERLLQVDIDE